MLRFTPVKGQVIILGLVFLGVVSLAAVSLVSFEGVYVRQARNNYHQEKTLALAEAGINKAIWQLNQTGGVYNGETLNFGGGTIDLAVTDLDSKNKMLEATAYFPDKISPLAQKKIRLKASAEPPSSSVSFHYGVQIGEGGVEMEEGAKINGNLYANGNFQGAGATKSTVTGDVWIAGGSPLTADQTSEQVDSDFIFGQSTPQIDAAQSFTPATSKVLNKVNFLLKKVGSPSNLKVYLVADDNGQPSKNSLGQLFLPSSLVTTNYGWVEVSFANPPALSAEMPYWLILDAGRDSNDYWFWGKDSSTGYPRGASFYSPDWFEHHPSWTALNADLAFKAWLGGVATFIDGLGISGDAHVNTLNNSQVGGNAYYQALNDTTVIGTKFPSSPDPGPQSYPISEANLTDWKAAAAVGSEISGDYHPGKDEIVFLGPKKITGNLILDNGQTLILTGTIWVQGHVEISNNASIRLDADYNDKSGLLLADGWLHLDNNGSFFGSGQPNSYLMLISLADCRGGDQTPACTNHNAAVDLHNNVDSTVFYAPNGLVYLHNRVKVKELTAWKIHLSQNTEIDYETGLANASFTNGPGGAWQAVRGTWQEVK